MEKLLATWAYNFTHTHTYIYIYIYGAFLKDEELVNRGGTPCPAHQMP
jgi:hypothetical protein